MQKTESTKKKKVVLLARAGMSTSEAMALARFALGDAKLSDLVALASAIVWADSQLVGAIETSEAVK
jgi:hypothetical protein